jgi:uncharacterized protein
MDGGMPATGVGVFRHEVLAAKTEEFLATQLRLVRLSSEFSGYEGATLIGPGPDSGEWLSILRYAPTISCSPG